ncbi:MAG TPA: phosphatidylglycerol lysyltransferase domain-containing protein, partial [Acidimicrobiales bacterium]|nr:phosphatidylglycerol lysyltransferase domain-containing protein [Acidimicrobiales bacterium]
ELSVVGNGFYANTGSGTTSVTGRRARLRLPPPFLAVERFSYVELHAGVVLEVRLWLREKPVRSPVLLERLALATPKGDATVMTRVAALPEGPTWPIDRAVLDRILRSRRIRRVASWLMFAAGVLNVVFAVLWHLTGTRAADRWLPFGVHPLTVVEATIAGVALCGLALGVRRGLRPAWLASIALLTVTSTDRLVTGHSAYGSAIALVFTLWLLLERRQFRVLPAGVTRLYMWIASSGLVVVAAAAGVGALFEHGHRQRYDFVFLILVITVAFVLLVSRPSRESRRTGKARSDAFMRAREIIGDYGGDTLDYFALRDDKSWFFTGRSFAAYSIINGVMLISPDPIGPPEERVEVWSDVMDHCQSNNWTPSVLGASSSWLPVYRASGLVDHYIGDEAIVDCTTFNLQGKAMKSLRGAYNRIKKDGCRVECYDDMDAVSPELRQQLLDLMTETRQGEAERGYSMTLSRIFDPRDRGLLLAVCFGPDGRPLAFNQYVPASEVNGYSLDLMRRTSDENAPNGLTDFVIIETIAWMAERSLRGLGLNFATMRAIVAGEAQGGPWTSLERSVLHHFSDTMQIESLWKFNKKYDPAWNPRYVVTGPFLPLARSGLAIARAESVSELPVIGPLLKRREPATTGD